MQGICRICAEKRFFWAEFAAIFLLSVLLAGCESAVEDTVEAPPASIGDADCGPAGFVQTELFGALAGEIKWDSTELRCEGMPRPDDSGARLRFAGTIAGAGSEEFELAFIIALPDLQRGASGKELNSTVTIIEEGAGRFFSNAEADTCWTDILALDALPGSDAQFAVEGSLYCVAPLIEVNGQSDVTLGEFSFRGLLDWDAS